MLNKIIGLFITIIIAIFVIAIIGIFALLGFGIASWLFGMWTIIGLCLIVLSIILAIVKPQILIWVPILIIGIILVFMEYINII